MILQDVINELYQKKSKLLEQQEHDRDIVRAIPDIMKNASLRWVLSEAISKVYEPALKQIDIEMHILECAQRKIEQG